MRQGLVAWAFVLAAGLFVSGDLDAGSLEPPGPPAPTMKTIHEVEPRIPISSLPFAISQPGSYYLAGNLTGVSGQNGITITASFVTVDLNGFTLLGVAGSLDGINANSSGMEHVEVRNGVVRNWGGFGISGLNTTEFHADDLRLDANGFTGISVGAGSIVRDTTATGNGFHGILASPSSTITGCTARNNVSEGFHVNSYGVITDCTAQGNAVGFSLANGGRIAHSLARSNATGIVATDTTSIEGCTAEENTDDGIRVTGSAYVRGNVARSNTNDGIQVSGSFSRIDENLSIANGVGIRVDAGNNVIVRNNAGSNGTEYVIAAGNQVGTINNNPATAGAWANFDQ